MQKVRVLLVAPYTYRHFSINSINCKNSIKQEARMLTKLLKRSSKSKWDLQYAEIPSSFSLESQSKGPSPHVIRRVTVLNKVFMDHIVEIMSSCAIYEETVGTCIEITHVQITNDFKFLNIFWFDELSNVDDSKKLEEKLHKYAGPLRHQLAQLRVIGKVPIVQFVRDRNVNLMHEIERRLAQADFGEDYERSPAYFKNEETVTYQYPSEVKDEDRKSKCDDVDEIFSVTLPAMRHDVFGLDHSKIMQKVQVAVNKKVAAKEMRKMNRHHTASNDQTDSSLAFLNLKEQQGKFAKFLREREKQEKRKRKEIRRRADMSMNEDINANHFVDDEDYDPLNTYSDER